MTVVVKPIDEYRSKVFKGRTITQYIVYLMINGQPITAELALGDSERDSLIAVFLKEANNKS